MKVVLATGNPGKLKEVQELMTKTQFQFVPQSDFGVPEIEETGLTFVENALLKARNAAAHTGLPAIADDSGLEVRALNGAPGIYSARYAGGTRSDKANNEKLLQAMKSVPDIQRQARYYCVMVFLRHADDPTPIIAEGVWNGRIMHTPRGSKGFGYDPIFFDPIHGKAAAELEPAEKNRISHRAKALQLMHELLSNYYR